VLELGYHQYCPQYSVSSLVPVPVPVPIPCSDIALAPLNSEIPSVSQLSLAQPQAPATKLLGPRECSELSAGFPLDSQTCSSNQQVWELVGFRGPQHMVVLSHFGSLTLSMEDDSSGSNSTNGACLPYSSSFTSPPYPTTLGDRTWTSMHSQLPSISSFVPLSIPNTTIGPPTFYHMMSCILLILTPRAGHLVTSSGTCTLPCRNPMHSAFRTELHRRPA